MEKLFSDLEGLRIAMEIEVRGQEFYKQAYDQTPKEQDKKYFRLLMEEEVQHYKTFSAAFDSLKEHKEANTEDYLFDPDTSRYLTVLAELHVFPKTQDAPKVIAELKDVAAILNLAIQAEKDSVLFYDELAQNAKFDEAKQVFLMLKKEEQEHIVKLSKLIQP